MDDGNDAFSEKRFSQCDAVTTEISEKADTRKGGRGGWGQIYISKEG